MTKRRNVFSAAFEAAAAVAASAPPQGDGDDLWWWDESESEFRILQDETPPDHSTDDSGLATPATADGTNDSVVLRQTFLVYGTALLFVVLLFCWVRLKFPRVYNLRSGWVEALKRSTESPPQQTLSPLPDSSSSSPEPEVSQLAQNQHQFVSWIWKLYMITDDELVHDCGMDALCLVRIMHMGYRLSVVGMVNAMWLMPLYATSEASAETESITDPIVETTTANVPSGSLRLIGTALAAYVFFGYAMYQIVEEFAWFIEMRHKFLRKPMARNYSIFVRNIPPALLSNQKVEDFFRGCFAHHAILEARLPMIANNLSKVQAKRDATLNKLERALAKYHTNPNGARPTHKQISIRNLHAAIIPLGAGPQQVDSIDAYQNELRELNQDVSRRITELENIANGAFFNNSNSNINYSSNNNGASSTTGEADVETPSLAMISELSAVPEDAASLLTNDQLSLPNNSAAETAAVTPTKTPTSLLVTTRSMIPRPESQEHSSSRSSSSSNIIVNNGVIRVVSMGTRAVSSGLQDISGKVSSIDNGVIRAVSKGTRVVSTGLQDITGKVGNIALDAVDGVGNVAGNVTSTAAALLAANEDGKVQSAGFVTFTKLSTANAAKQMILNQTPFAMEAIEAPDPDDVNWKNVSRTHKDLQLGMLSSAAMTTALCLFWTIPMAFVSSLSSVSALRNQFPSIDSLLDAMPWLEPVLQVLAPQFVIILNAMLPSILEFITDFEGLISSALVTASLFVKLASFMIIQTFFISALSGGVFQELHNIIEDPASIIELLAKSLPAQATYFCQIAFVGTVTSATMELLRIVPLILALLRQCIGPRLTEKERQTTFMGLRPLCDPVEFGHADFTSQAVLYFMVMLVYAVISPITSFVTALCFLVMGSIFRHQFVYIYPTVPDSGGKIWMGFIRTLLPCLIVAEITIVGLLALKKAGIAVTLFIPLLIITILFSGYIHQMHFRVAEFLPTREALKEDRKRSITSAASDLSDLDFLRGAYTQPELAAEKEIPIPSVMPGYYSTTTTTPSSYNVSGDVAAAWMEQERGGVPGMVRNEDQRRQGHESGADEGETTANIDNRESSQSILSSVWGMFSATKTQ